METRAVGPTAGIVLGFVVFLASGLLAAPPVRSEETPVLRIFSWSSYIDVDDSIPGTEPIEKRSPTLSAFAAAQGCRVEYYEYDDEAMMREKVLGQPGFFDVACMSLSDSRLFLEAGKLARIPKGRIPNHSHLMPLLASIEFDPNGDYFVPFLIGTEGLAYRRDLVGHEVTSWETYFNPPDALKGKLAALNSAETMIAASLKSDGHRLNGNDPRNLRDAARRLRRLKTDGFLTLITSDIVEIQRKLGSGEVAMSVLYSGDALSAAEEDPTGNLVYVIPREGATAFMDCWVVFGDSKNLELAFSFLNHLLDPEVHARNAAYLRYLCPNEKAIEVLREHHPDILSNPSILPSEEVMETLEFQWESDVATMNQLWRRVVE